VIPTGWAVVIGVGGVVIGALGAIGVLATASKELDRVGEVELDPDPEALREQYGQVADDYEDGDLDPELDEEWHRQMEDDREYAPEWWQSVPEDRT
jgi:hypothetical protein